MVRPAIAIVFAAFFALGIGCGSSAPSSSSSSSGPEAIARPLERARRVDWDAGKENPGADGMLALVNAYRRAAGVAPVPSDPTLTKGCREHAEYMVLNRGKPQMYSINAHNQDPALPGATPEGAECAKNAVLYPAVPDVRDAVHGWMASIYHRQPIISPQIERVGIGSSPLPAGGWVAVALRFVYRAADRATFPVAFPADGQIEVPIDFRNESPTPIPPGGSATPGYPFTLQFPPYEPLTDASATLTDDAGNTVEVYLSSPEKPASQYYAQPGLIGVIPRQTLRAGARYTASVTATWNGTPGSWTATFSTMARIELAATDEAGLLAAIGKPARVRGRITRASKITEGTAIIDLEGPAGGSILKVAATVPLDKVAAEFKLTSKTRYLNELDGLTVEVDATPALHFSTLRLDATPTSEFRVVR